MSERSGRVTLSVSRPQTDWSQTAEVFIESDDVSEATGPAQTSLLPASARGPLRFLP